MEIVPKKVCEWERMFQKHLRKINIECINLSVACYRLYKVKYFIQEIANRTVQPHI